MISKTRLTGKSLKRTATKLTPRQNRPLIRTPKPASSRKWKVLNAANRKETLWISMLPGWFARLINSISTATKKWSIGKVRTLSRTRGILGVPRPYWRKKGACKHANAAWPVLLKKSRNAWVRCSAWRTAVSRNRAVRSLPRSSSRLVRLMRTSLQLLMTISWRRWLHRYTSIRSCSKGWQPLSKRTMRLLRIQVKEWINRMITDTII